VPDSAGADRHGAVQRGGRGSRGHGRARRRGHSRRPGSRGRRAARAGRGATPTACRHRGRGHPGLQRRRPRPRLRRCRSGSSVLVRRCTLLRGGVHGAGRSPAAHAQSPRPGDSRLCAGIGDAARGSDAPRGKRRVRPTRCRRRVGHRLSGGRLHLGCLCALVLRTGPTRTRTDGPVRGAHAHQRRAGRRRRHRRLAAGGAPSSARSSPGPESPWVWVPGAPATRRAFSRQRGSRVGQ
jgi:hypothetical protein